MLLEDFIHLVLPDYDLPKLMPIPIFCKRHQVLLEEVGQRLRCVVEKYFSSQVWLFVHGVIVLMKSHWASLKCFFGDPKFINIICDVLFFNQMQDRLQELRAVEGQLVITLAVNLADVLGSELVVD